MLKFKSPRLLPLLGLMLLAFMLPGKACASDLDIFDIITENVKPNVLIVLDISGSMGYTDVAPGDQQRLQVARNAITDLVRSNVEVDDYGNKTTTVRWGLMTFPHGNNESGRIQAECMVRKNTEIDDFVNFINDPRQISANGGTPVASALAEAGLYFAGSPSFFWTGVNYTSPIENVCQINYVILITDGFSSVDSGVRGGFGDMWDNNKYNVASRQTIFFRPYINNRVIDGNTDPYGMGSYGYITWKTLYAPLAERVNLGAKLAPFVKNFHWNAAQNNAITGNVSANTSWYDRITWGSVDAGSPLSINGQLTQAQLNQLITDNTPYIYGYNAADPSRPIPALPYTKSGTNTTIDLYNQGYVNPTQIFQGNIWNSGAFASDYLDDVAAFLNNEDLRMDLGRSGNIYEKQTVKTFVIGFKFSNDLLERTAIMGGTGDNGEGYFTADDYSGLSMSLAQIMTNIKDEMSVYAAPSIPPNTDRDFYAGKYLYMGLFKPDADFWPGNLKKYELINNSMQSYLDANGTIKSDARSVWSSEVDGNDVTKGGAAEKIKAMVDDMAGISNTLNLRHVYTYLYNAQGGPNADLTHNNNLVWENNSKLTPEHLGLTTEAEKKAAITAIRQTPMGAVIHSTPTIARYTDTLSIVFVGAQDGFLHAINDATGKEEWAFVMPEHLGTIKDAYNTNPNTGNYYIDGHIGTRTINGQKILLIGARRGGHTYAALDITTYDKPRFLYQIPSLISPDSWNAYNLGLAWSAPLYINTHNDIASTGNIEQIDGCISHSVNVNFSGIQSTGHASHILLPGGYDNRYDTLKPHEIIGQIKGAAIIGINPVSGALSDVFDKLNSANSDLMQHSVLDVLAMDSNNDIYVDTLYYGDMGGNVFYAIPYQMTTGIACGDSIERTFTVQKDFEAYKLFQTAANSGRSFMFAPDVIIENDSEYLYMGSGNREKPLDKTVQNRFYCIKNTGKKNLSYNTSDDFHLKELRPPQDINDTDSDLADVSQNLIQSANNAEQLQAQDLLDRKNGWFFDLRQGEQVVGRAIVFAGIVYFTTFQPVYDELPNPSDICRSGGASGIARLYAVDYINGGAKDKSGKRDAEIGVTVPSAPILAIFNNSTVKIFVLVGRKDVEGNNNIGVVEVNADGGKYANIFYWREAF